MAKRVIPGHAGATGLAVAIIAGDGRNLADGSTLAVNGSVTTRTSSLDGATELVFATNSDYLRCTKGQPSQINTPSGAGLSYAFIADWTQDVGYPSDNCLFSAYATNYGNTLWCMAGFSASDQTNFFNRGARYVDNRSQPSGPDVFRAGSTTQRRRWMYRQNADDSSRIQRFNGTTYSGMPYQSGSSAFSDQGDILIGRKYADSWGAANLFLRYLLIWDGAGAVLPSQATLEALADDPSSLFEDEPTVSSQFALTAQAAAWAGGVGPSSTANFALVGADTTWSGYAGTVPGSFLTPPLKNNTGTVLSGLSGVTVNVYNLSTGALIVSKTGLTTDGNGRILVSDVALQAGTTVLFDPILPGGARRMPTIVVS